MTDRHGSDSADPPVKSAGVTRRGVLRGAAGAGVVAAAASAVTDGTTPADLNVLFLDRFPYLGVPHSGYSTPSE